MQAAEQQVSKFEGDLLRLPDDPNEAQELLRYRYVIEPTRFIVLSIISLGIFEAYWFYKQWLFYTYLGKVKGSPFLHAAFAPLASFMLFPHVLRMATAHGFKAPMGASALSLLWIAPAAFSRLPDPYSLLSATTFIAPLFALKAVNHIWRSVDRSTMPSTLSRGAKIWVAIGAVLFILSIIGVLMPPEVRDIGKPT